MKKITLLLVLLLGAFYSFAQLTQPPNGDNQKSVTTQYIGSLAKVTITYNSPNVHGPNNEDRTGKIWGHLVPYGLTDQGFGTSKALPAMLSTPPMSTTNMASSVRLARKRPTPATLLTVWIARPAIIHPVTEPPSAYRDEARTTISSPPAATISATMNSAAMT